MAFDVDGVLTDGTVAVLPNGDEVVSFHRRDGEGIRQLKAAGFQVGFFTHEAHASYAVKRRAWKLGVTLWEGVADKADAMRSLHYRPQEICFMGDDVLDVAAMKAAGFSAAPADAHPEARTAADLVTSAGGGRGAVRELCDALLKARGHA